MRMLRHQQPYHEHVHNSLAWAYLHVISQICTPDIFLWCVIPVVLLSIPEAVVTLKPAIQGRVLLLKKSKMPLKENIQKQLTWKDD